MTVLATILSDCWLCIMLLLSVVVATWWGELAGILPGQDKSGLGGFAAIYLFLPVRWLGLALLLPSWSWLAAHAVLGALSAFGFERGVERVQQDRELPAALGLLGALLPVPVFAVEFAAVHQLSMTGPVALLGTLAIAGLHAAPCLHRRSSMRRVRPQAMTIAPDGEPPFK